MAHIYRDRVADITLTTGTGPLGVSGIAPQNPDGVTNVRTFNDVCSLGDTFYCATVNRNANEWEVGLYTYFGVGQLSRSVIFDSTNHGQQVNFSAGIKDVFLTMPARTTQFADQAITNAGETLVDFGAWPGNATAQTVITGQGLILLSSYIMANLIAIDTVDHSADEHWLDPPLISAGNIVQGTGFTIFATPRGGDRYYGKYTVGWFWK